MKTSAMLFAAGLGTRLYPLTAKRPKALLLYNGKPLLAHIIEKITGANIRHIVINVHHFADQIEEWVARQHYEADIEFSNERSQLLDTGGGLKFAEPLLAGSSRILLHNTDIISTIDLAKLLEAHEREEALATLAVRERCTSRYFIFDRDTMQLCGWCNKTEKNYCWRRSCTNPVELAFSGIHVVSPEIFNRIATPEKQSLTTIYLALSARERLVGYLDNSDFWQDMGKDPAQLI
ncbi:MAG: nucleotidyltransferase family protein [Bacteroidales bacterium]|jgi:NDP-sugar pyrophosphorylase family protein|nr:nucleotidyltransferase family protein [Bacteroidales bacterium]